MGKLEGGYQIYPFPEVEVEYAVRRVLEAICQCKKIWSVRNIVLARHTQRSYL